jgi:hypothetical protein
MEGWQWRRVGYKLLAHAFFGPPEKAYGNIQVEQRGYGTGSFDRGKGVFIPFTAGTFFTRVLTEKSGAKKVLAVASQSR